MGKISENGLVLRGLAMNKQLKFAVGLSTPITQTILEAHNPSAQGLLAMSRAATAVGLLSTTLKGRQQVGIQVNGDGPLGELYALSTSSGEVRVTASKPEASVAPESEVGSVVGSGRFTLIKTSDTGEPYRGTVPIFTGGIAEDLAYYFMFSEQIPTACGLGESIEEDQLITGGYLVQSLPDPSDEALSTLEQRVVTLPPLKDILNAVNPLEMLLELLFMDDYEILEESTICFKCPCERPKFARTLLTLGKAELTQIREEDGEMNISCHFCGDDYHFNDEELGALIYGARD
jgi:molecular chaperone Hsp33